MSTLQNLKNLSPFGTSALALDGDFVELERLSGQIQRIELDSDSDLERAQQLLVRFTECGQRIAEGIQGFARSLEEARLGAENAASVVAARAQEIQARQEESNKLLARFQLLSEMVKKISDLLGSLKKPTGVPYTEEEKTALQQQLPQVDSSLETLIDQALKLKEDARASKMKTLEKNADSLSQTMMSARRKLSTFVDRSVH